MLPGQHSFLCHGPCSPLLWLCTWEEKEISRFKARCRHDCVCFYSPKTKEGKEWCAIPCGPAGWLGRMGSLYILAGWLGAYRGGVRRGPQSSSRGGGGDIGQVDQRGGGEKRGRLPFLVAGVGRSGPSCPWAGGKVLIGPL